MTIGDRIRRIRKKRRLTQAELAMMSGLSLSAIRAYEQGRYEPKRKPLESIAEVFKIPADELYDAPAQHGTNLASLGTDCISRQAAIDWVLEGLNNMPSAQPEIVRCKDCIYYDPPHVENNGVRYEYDEMPADAFDALGTGLVNAEYGINIGGRCCVDYYCKNYSDDKRVFVREDNYCGRAERRTDE